MTDSMHSIHVRQPAGTPVGGQFAGKTPSLPEVTLSRADTSLLSIGMGELPDELPQVTTERNTRMRFTASAAVAAALAGALTFSLTGCASDSAPAPDAAATITQTPAVTETPAFPTDGTQAFATGTILTAEQGEALNEAKGETRAWEMKDGTWIAANVNEPVPQQILDEVGASVRGNSEHQIVSAGLFGSFDAKMGRFACQVVYGIVDPRGIDWDGFGWTAAAHGVTQVTFATQEEAVAQCEAWAAEAGASSSLAIVVSVF